MQNNVWQWMEDYARRAFRSRIWNKFIQMMVCVVVFCTTYALILPALTMEQTYTCGIEAHLHGETCYETRTVTALTCTPASGIHIHEEICHDAGGNLICTLEELAEHTHTEACYEAETLICGLEPVQAHTHGAACVDESGSLICTLPEYEVHQHTESCISVISEEQVLICGMEEHIHASSCNSNPEADVESPEQWESGLAQVSLTGSWTEDLLAVTRTQMGYQESELNFLMEDGVRKGYTRYGHWYGMTYADWDAMFVSFCLHYAGIPETAIPRSAYSGQWIEQLQALELVDTPDVRMPAAGEAVFFTDSDGAVRSGIIHGLDTSTDEAGASHLAQLRIIAGNIENRVTEVTVEPAAILGVVNMEKAALNAEAAPTEPETEAPAEVTEPTAPEGETLPTEPVEPTESTEPTEPAPMLTQQAETENYIVTVTYSAELALPEGAELRVTEYARDSEIFQQRCAEVGYELEWLLNIGFFQGDTELELDGAFDVVVTSKQGGQMGQDITHFADSGTEQLDAVAVEEDGQTSVQFSADGFSDFGGGVAPAAETGSDTPVAQDNDGPAKSYSFVTANPSQLKEGVDYAIYLGSGGTQTFLGTGLNAIGVNTGATWSPYNVGGTWTAGTGNLGTDIGAFTWRVIKQSDTRYLLYSPQKNQYLHVDWNSLKLVSTTDKQYENRNISGAASRLLHPWGDEGNYLRYNNGWTGTMTRSEAATVYFAEVTADYGNYPHAVHTGDVTINRLRFLNLRGNGSNGVRALPGCEFRVVSDAVDSEGKPLYDITIISGDDPIVQLPADIPVGSYTITEVSAADGYIRDDDPVRHFAVEERLGEKTFVTNQSIGFFMNHPTNEMDSGKTAEVEDYENRIYQVLLDATANLRKYEMDPIDVRLVVDQSNSMLFPSGMTAMTGKSVTLGLNDAQNDDRMEALGLDKTKMHYIISDPGGTATVWCVWHDGTTWMYQDASYYAKAKHGNVTGYQTPGEEAIFPIDASYADQPTTTDNPNFDKARANGGALNKSLVGSGLGTYIDSASGDSRTFQIYTANGEYNRLHYLEQALGYLVVELADANPANRVSLTLFTKTVDHSQCIPGTELTPDAVTNILDTVDSINTSGGTRQDIALDHVYEHASHEPAAGYKSYTVLITDGAPVTSGDQTSLGNPYDDGNINENSSEVYPRIRAEAQKIRDLEHSTLMTVALAMDNVDGGSHVLEKIATPGYSFAYSDAADLIHALQELIYRSFTLREEIPVNADIVDEISDSFYPIAWVPYGEGTATGRKVLEQDPDTGRDWIQLEAGDWITLEGQYTTDVNAAGQLLRKDDGTFYIRWRNESISGGWNGTFYLKAKEDFIGGNAIHTNKTAYLSYAGEENPEVYFDKPTVNVRLLNINEMGSEVTVYLGDLINEAGSIPLDSLKYFFDQTYFEKLVAGTGDILNAVASADWLDEDKFFLPYALGGQLTAEQWQDMAVNGSTITIPYTYDFASSEGPVGEFTFRLSKTGETADYLNAHEAEEACQPGGQPLTENCGDPVETYTLHITYTAYTLGQTDAGGNLLRPEENQYNSGNGPGTEVGGEDAGDTVETGLGVLGATDTHEVHVISGKIEVVKYLAEGLTAEEDHDFLFTLHRLVDGSYVEVETKTITVKQGTSQGALSIVFDGLERGVYTVTEATDLVYTLKSVEVSDSTNCYATAPSDDPPTQLSFTMGHNTAYEDVIGKEDGELYLRYIDPVNGVYGKAEFTNAKIVYEGEIPVTKAWDDGAENHVGDAVYLVLYKDGVPVVDTDGNARILRLDAAGSWTGTFTVTLADSEDHVTKHNYTVREVTRTSDVSQDGWYAAVLENDGSTIVYYEKTVDQDGLTAVGGKSYVVDYAAGENGAWTVTNIRAVELPMTGGPGTHLYTISGLLLTAAALVYGCSQRRKRERRGSQ